MEIKISDDILKKTNLSAEDIKIEIAVLLYKKEVLTLRQASELTKLHQIQFQKELAKRKISLNYDIESFREDLSNIGYSQNL